MIGMDNKLKASGAPAYAKVSDTAVTNANNNIMANSAGAGRAATQKMGGRGMSMGRGQQARADRAQQDATIKGYLGAARNDMAASQQNAAIDSAYDNMRQNSMVNTQGLLSGLRNGQMDQSMLGQAGDMMGMSGQNFVNSASIGLDKAALLKHLM